MPVVPTLMYGLVTLLTLCEIVMQSLQISRFCSAVHVEPALSYYRFDDLPIFATIQIRPSIVQRVYQCGVLFGIVIAVGCVMWIW
jgi:hypothetical protein